jgi:IS30 family transposase
MQTHPELVIRSCGERNGSAKLTNEQRGQVCELYRSGIGQYDLADRFEVAQSTISRIIGRRILEATHAR